MNACYELSIDPGGFALTICNDVQNTSMFYELIHS